MRRELLVALAHTLLVAAMGGKFAWDRETLPRGWMRTLPADPSTPLRGRYVQLFVEVEGVSKGTARAKLPVADGVVRGAPDPEGLLPSRWGDSPALAQPLAFFIPEPVPDTSIRPAGQELRVEVTVPRAGPPRPLRPEWGTRKSP